MSIFKEAGDSILKYGEIVINKTEEYTKIAKLKLEIKQLEGEIEKCHIRAGRLAASEHQKGQPTFDLTQNEIKEIVEKIDSLNEKIEMKKREIESVKKGKDTEKEDQSGGSQGKDSGSPE